MTILSFTHSNVEASAIDCGCRKSRDDIVRHSFRVADTDKCYLF